MLHAPIEIIPSLLVRSKKEFETKLRQVEKHVKTVHIDILDGTLFENISWFEAQDVGAMRTDVKFELHLMVENPLPLIKAWKTHVPGTCRAIIHAEIHRQPGAIVDIIRDEYHLEAGLALNPETPLQEEHHLIHTLQQLTLMSVHPGRSGAPFAGDFILQKIQAAHAHQPLLPIEIDGGLTRELLPDVVRAGATRLCTASLLFGAEDPGAMLEVLNHDILAVTSS